MLNIDSGLRNLRVKFPCNHPWKNDTGIPTRNVKLIICFHLKNFSNSCLSCNLNIFKIFFKIFFFVEMSMRYRHKGS